ncbi:MAG: hypothetical protein HQ511_04805, partial [Rhodospirillales bacterium]|nr:hypothetical protein [Rhodospirillales bacterium]
MTEESVLPPAERAYRRDRIVVLSGIVLLLALSWAYTLWTAGEVYGHGAHGALGPHSGGWGLTELLFVFVMWLVM